MNADLTPAERKQAIEDGRIPANTAGLSDDERKSAAFWTKHWADHPDKKHPKKAANPRSPNGLRNSSANKPPSAQRGADQVLAV